MDPDGLLIPAVVVIASQIIRPDAGLELVRLVYTVPVAVANRWEWFEPEIAVKIFKKG